MILRFLLLLAVVSSLNAKELSWYNKIHPSIEAGMHMSEFDGTLSNAFSSSDFRDDFRYTDTTSSYFALGLRFDYDYMPNIDISYFNDKQNNDSKLNKKTYVADGIFDANSTVSTKIEYQVLNIVLHKDFKKKGSKVKLFKWKFYPGDIEFNVGMNVKIIKWKFTITDTTISQPTTHWVTVDEYIPLPYIGFRWYYYNLRVYASSSALALSEAKSTNYEIGIDYRVIDNLYLSASYLYEDFKATEKKDTIDFQTSGNKFSFKYIF